MATLKQCLVVDDSDIVRRYTRLIFEALDFRVTEAATAEEATQRILTETPEFIMVDWRIPGSNMIEFIQSVRQAPDGNEPHIIYMMTENDPIENQAATRAGANGTILKPFNKDIIAFKLHEIKVAA